MNGLSKLLVIVGSTAVGKTLCSLQIARSLNGEVVSADSRCLYRGMNIGTAKPDVVEMESICHHLIDVANPDTAWSLAKYKRAACEAIADIQDRGKLPILVGGTGQYVKAILEGWNIPPRPDDQSLRSELEAIAGEPDGEKALMNRLVELDPDAAKTIDRRNVRRVIRALEVTLFTGEPFSAQRQKSPPTYDTFVMGLRMSRQRLYARIDARIEAMVRGGWVEEVSQLLHQGYHWKMPAMSALGYREIGAYLDGEIDLVETKQRIRRASRRLVRRQSAWFRADDENIHWYEAGEYDMSTMQQDIARWCAGRQPEPGYHPKTG